MMSKKAVVPILILLTAGAFFYLAARPAKVPVAPATPASTSTAQASGTAPATPTAPAAATTSQNQAPQAARPASGPRVKIGPVSIPVELARTSAEVIKGLSGRSSLAADAGMLFIFSKPDNYRFWMPDMNFPIDIVWISTAKTILGVAANVSNEFDPANPKYYTPPAPAQYVLEVNAGFAARAGIKTGDKVTFLGI